MRASIDEKLEKLKRAIPDFLKAVREGLLRESKETVQMLQVLLRLSLGEHVSEEEKRSACRQLGDLAKLVPALAIFMLPGGTILLPLFARILPFHLLPEVSFTAPNAKEGHIP